MAERAARPRNRQRATPVAAATVPAAPQMDSATAQLLAALEQANANNARLHSELERQGREIADLRNHQPRVERLPGPARGRTGGYERPEQLRELALKKAADNHETSRRVTLPTKSGVRTNLPEEYMPLFEPGERVRINPDALVHGSVSDARPEGILWRDVLAQSNADGYGEILGIQYISRNWETKYKAVFKGITPAQGDGIRESELLPA